MIVIPEARALLFQFDDPNAALKQIPFSSLIEHEGQQFVMVPHHEDSVKLLRNLGLKVPGMMTYYYDWPGRFPPWYHQRVTAEFCVENDRCFVLNEIGTGKTASVIWAADYLRKKGKVQKVLIASPKSTLREVWEKEIAQIDPAAKVAVVHGTPDKRTKLLAGDYDYFIFTHKGLEWYAQRQRKDVDLIIIDELANFKTKSTKLWAALDFIITPKMRAIGMTGTPTPNEPTDAWAQAKAMKTGKGNVPKFFGAFRREVMQQLTQYRWIPIPGWERRIYDLMQPAVRFTRDGCFDLPETTYTNRKVDLTSTQTAVYDLVKRDLYAEYQQGKILAVNEATKIMRLVQVASGVVYDTEQNHLVLGADARIAELKQIYDEVGGKIIVFAPYTGTVQYIYSQLKDVASCAMVYGETSMTKRSDIFNKFQNTEDIRILIAQPGTMAHGLTLTRSATIVWFAPINNNGIYTQANGRITRPGQKAHTNIIHLYATVEERRMFQHLKNKTRMEGILLAEFAKGTQSWN